MTKYVRGFWRRSERNQGRSVGYLWSETEERWPGIATEEWAGNQSGNI